MSAVGILTREIMSDDSETQWAEVHPFVALVGVVVTYLLIIAGPILVVLIPVLLLKGRK